MSNYFRITVFLPNKHIAAVFESHGRFEKLWQFSAFLVAKGFKIIDVDEIKSLLNTKEEPFDENKIFICACRFEC